MTDHHTESLLDLLQQINASLAHLVSIQKERLELERNLQMTPEIVNALITALTALTALVTAQAGNAAALAAAQKALADLQATDTALQDPALVQAANDAIAAASAATTPAVIPPVNPPVGAP